jgi:hypothetical protein
MAFANRKLAFRADSPSPSEALFPSASHSGDEPARPVNLETIALVCVCDEQVALIAYCQTINGPEISREGRRALNCFPGVAASYHGRDQAAANINFSYIPSYFTNKKISR